ncbi:protein DpdH [Chloroflexota bacterium]
MPLNNYSCWKNEYIYRVMDTEALQPENHYFLATHHPSAMQKVQRGSIEGSGNPISENDLLNEFLDPVQKHVNTVILGSTGSGKSHLIRWLYNNIPPTNNRKIVLIPKAQTNLREIIKKLMLDMEGPEFDELRKKIDTATANLTPKLARELLHANLIVAVGPEGPFSKEKVNNQLEREEREYLIGSLPSLLSTPTFKNVLTSEGGILDQFSQRIVGQLGVDRRDKPLEFNVEDFKIDEWNIRDSDLDVSARYIYADFRQNKGIRERVVNWLNKNLEWAVSHVLDLDSNDLGTLMFNLRETLAVKNQELIILMEDFSRSQGIDGQLIDSLTISQEQVGRTLCVMRWAIAVTTGYYNTRFENTTRERIDILVNMDVPTPTSESNIGDILVQFSSRYLNAIRLDSENLENWYSHNLGMTESKTAIPNACDECPHREDCHSAFGSVDRIGIYPFTPKTIERMYNIVAKDTKIMNPRDLINSVLRDVLIQAMGTMNHGEFPSKELLTNFGGGKMTAVNRQKLREAVPSTKLDQYRTLIELWGDPDRIPGISKEVFKAFGLQDITLEILKGEPESEESEETGETQEPDPPVSLPESQELQNDLNQLNEWINDEKFRLSQALVQRLRERLFEHVTHFIDWDNEMLVKSFYVGPTKAFQRTSINFIKQGTQFGQNPVRIELPLDNDFNSASLALQGLLLNEHHGHWAFNDGNLHFQSFIKLLENSSNEVLRQLRQLQIEKEKWDPVPTAVELLAIGAKLRGESVSDQDELGDGINSLFLNWDDLDQDSESLRSKNWQNLSRAFKEYGNEVVRILLSRIACTKGGYIRAQIIDSVQIIDMLESIRDTWQPINKLPDTIRDDYRNISRLHQRVDQLLGNALNDEQKKYKDWCNMIKKHFDTTVDSSKVIENIKDTLILSFNHGYLSKGQVEDLEHSIDRFKVIDIPEMIQKIERLEDTSIVFQLLPILGNRDLNKNIITTIDFIESTNEYLASISEKIQSDIENSVSHGKVLEIQKSISSSFKDLQSMLSIINKGNNSDS